MPQSLTAKTLLLSSGKILAAFSTIGITAILTRTLTMDDYATHRQALLMYAMVAPALMLGLPKALYFFIPGDEARARSLLLSNLLGLASMGALFAVVMWCGLGQAMASYFDNPALVALGDYVGVYALFILPTSAFGACMMTTDRVARLVATNVITQLLLVVVVAFAAIEFGHPQATIGAYVAWSAVVFLVTLVMMFQATNKSEDRQPRWSDMRSQVKYAVPLGLASMFGAISTQVDKFIVSTMCSPAEFAIYVTGALELPLIGIVTGAMSAVVLPELAKFFKQGNTRAIVSLWQRAMNKAILVLAPAMFGVLLLGPELMTVLFGDAYIDASDPLRVYALQLPARSAVYGSVLMATNETRWVTIAAIVGLTLNTLMSLLMVYLLGPTGAAWASVVTTYSVILFMVWMMTRVLDTRIQDLIAWTYLARVCVVAGLPAAALFFGSFLWAPETTLVRLVVMGALYVGIVLVAYAKWGIATPAELLAFLRRRNNQAM
ncbi:MAG: lipid II flippase MurJ [Myxococcota bacterium]|nr:lipid II flippase MurJ [Myxococcota bacterium]